MYRPTIQSKRWLGVMTVVFIALYYWSDTSTVIVDAPHFDVKMNAAELMLTALETLQDYRLPQLGEEKSASSSDPLIYTMLGEKDSPITTDEGNIDEKVTVLNPNFAAVLVELLAKAGVDDGDTIAGLMTGSMPGANLALFSAAKALNLHVVAITSVGSSWWGANSPDFTWLDMESILVDNSVFPYRSVAASIGGSDDNGGLRLSNEGRRLIADAVDRNDITLIKQGSLTDNINGRVEVFERQASISAYKAVVNIGGGIAALGHRANGTLIPTGVNKFLPAKNYPNLGVIHKLASSGIPVVHIYNIEQLANEFNLPVAQLPLPQVGIGDVYRKEQYNLTTASIALALMFLVLAVVKYFDRQTFKWREQKNDSESVM